MNTIRKLLATLIIFIIAMLYFSSCGDDDGSKNKEIIYKSCNTNVVMLLDVNEMVLLDNPYARHIDSIVSGFIDAELISTGWIRVDLDNDNITDVAFEIVNLQSFNNNDIPEYLDTLALRAHSVSVDFLDNSTYRYADALSQNAVINIDGNWTNQTVALGTLGGGGQFSGKGFKYLGFRLTNADENYKYGWIKLYCSEHNDTLKIIDFAYNNISGSQIIAGQQE
ncbi:MAG: hypothetical protein PHW82_09645 [Bacteroidales bacterium]|nr:hypothetical protein [Bacteroidales bacterium]